MKNGYLVAKEVGPVKLTVTATDGKSRNIYAAVASAEDAAKWLYKFYTYDFANGIGDEWVVDTVYVGIEQKLGLITNEQGLKKIIVSDPKSFASVRVIPLPDFLIDMLRHFAGRANSFVLASENKEYTEPRIMQNKFKKYFKEGQIAEANFHSLRHTFATRCIELGFDVKSLSEILGHSSENNA